MTVNNTDEKSKFAFLEKEAHSIIQMLSEKIILMKKINNNESNDEIKKTERTMENFNALINSFNVIKKEKEHMRKILREIEEYNKEYNNDER